MFTKSLDVPSFYFFVGKLDIQYVHAPTKRVLRIDSLVVKKYEGSLLLCLISFYLYRHYRDLMTTTLFPLYYVFNFVLVYFLITVVNISSLIFFHI